MKGLFELRRLILPFLLCALLIAWPARAGEAEDAQKILASADAQLDRFLTAHPTTTHRCELLLAAARAPQPLFDALRRLHRTLDACAGQPQAPQALADVAMLNHLSGQDLAAYAVCRDFLAQYPDHELAPQVLLLQGALEISYQSGRFAGNSYALFLSRYPQHPLTAVALVGVADAKLKHGDWSGAHQVYLQALHAAPDTLDMPKVLFNLGQTAEMMGDEPRARHYYQEDIRLFGESVYASRARDRLDSVLANGPPREPPLPDHVEARFAAQVGVYNSLAEAEHAGRPFREAGYPVRFLLRTERYLLLVGEFRTEADARIFADELTRRYGVRATAAPLP
jgi:TolA-binding protein